MTREDYINNLQSMINDAEDMGLYDEDVESLQVAIEALEQEPCEDAISRQAVLDLQYRIDDSATLSTRDVVNVDDIEDLPSVNPKPKTGHWEDCSNGWMCSVCERDSRKDTNYCPNCGAKMESEE